MARVRILNTHTDNICYGGGLLWSAISTVLPLAGFPLWLPCYVLGCPQELTTLWWVSTYRPYSTSCAATKSSWRTFVAWAEKALRKPWISWLVCGPIRTNKKSILWLRKPMPVQNIDLYREVFREFESAHHNARPINYALLYQKELLRKAAFWKSTMPSAVWTPKQILSIFWLPSPVTAKMVFMMCGVCTTYQNRKVQNYLPYN